MYIQSFIANYSVSKTLDEALDQWERFGTADSIEELHREYYESDLRCIWSVPRWAKIDDLVLLMETVSSQQHINRMTKELYDYGHEIYSLRDYKSLIKSLVHSQEYYDEVGGCIFGIARIAGNPQNDVNDEEYERHWRSNIYSQFKDLFILDRCIPFERFKGFIEISKQSTITPVFGEEFKTLKQIILEYNKEVPNWFVECEADPIPLSKINMDNFMDVSGRYRRSFFLESQFRTYYVNYLLRVLSDIKTIYRECECVKKNNSNKKHPRIDNIIQYNGKYLGVEVKLNVNIEPDLIGQLNKYYNADEIKITDNKVINKKEIHNGILVIDTEHIYYFDGTELNNILSLDMIKSLLDIKDAKKKIDNAIIHK